jgi:hypothetical protein
MENLVLLPYCLFVFAVFLPVRSAASRRQDGGDRKRRRENRSDHVFRSAVAVSASAKHRARQSDSEDLNRALRLLIDQRLILQEAEKFPRSFRHRKRVSDARDELARNFPSPLEFQQRLQRVGLTSEKLDEIVEQRLKMEKYLDFRFRNFVVISQKEIADYYRDVYVPRFQARFPDESCRRSNKFAARSRRR